MPHLNDEQKQMLRQPLDPKHVAKRDGPGGKPLDYIQAWHAIDEANRIFDFAWDCRVVELRALGVTSKNKVHYLALVEVTAGGSTRQDVGYGIGNHADDHEFATKEAVSDALKRTLKDWGYPFGLALYDKTRAHVEAPPPSVAVKKGPAFLGQLGAEKKRIGLHQYYAVLKAHSLPPGNADAKEALADGEKERLLQDLAAMPTLSNAVMGEIIKAYDLDAKIKETLAALKEAHPPEKALIKGEKALWTHFNPTTE